MRIFFFTLLVFASVSFANAQTKDSLNLMPLPQSVSLQNGRFIFTTQFTIGIQGPVSEKLVAAVNRFYAQLGKRTGIYFPQEYIKPADNKQGAQLSVQFGKTIKPEIGMDESYHVSVSATGITLNATTDIGAIRGLETIYQLVMPDHSGYFCPVAEISDAPRFKWRGLMLDVARHFITIETLKRNVEAMAIVKLNVLHLHLSDDEGFRVESKIYPKLQELGSNGQYYTQEQIKDLVNFAHERGIIVIPEFDLPGHCTSMLAGYPFLASYPSNYKPAKRFNLDTVKNLNLMTVMKLINEIPTPTIDPSKESTYIFFDHFFGEMSGLFPDAYLHIGADENNGVAWKQNPAIVAFMKATSIKNTDDLQAYFVRRLYTIAKKYNKRVIGWEEAFNASLPEDMIVQKWKPVVADTLAAKIVHHNNQIIVSNGYYLDYFLPAYIHYSTDPVPSTLNQAEVAKGILGSEAAMWAELVNTDNEEIRVWPRAAAFAERLWSVAEVKDVDDMYRRLWLVDIELNDRAIDENNNYMKLISRWANGADVTPVKTVTDMYTPVKGYRRLMADMINPGKVPVNTTLLSPMVNIADVAHCDSKACWYFRQLVASYLAKHDSASLAQIKEQLMAWKNNNLKFNAVAANSPYLRQVTSLSDNLSATADIGLNALNNQSDKDALLKQLQQYTKPQFEVQLSILPEIEALITGKLREEPKSYTMF